MFSRIFEFFRTNKVEHDPMKFLIVGLGNIGAEYVGTRHNIGFEVVDQIAEETNAQFKNESHGALAEVKFRGKTLVLLKPSTLMNRSGKAIRYWLQKKKIKPENLLVIVDDLNLEFGKLRIKAKGSDGGHNGLKDIIAMFGNQNFARLRVGIGSDYSKGKQVNFVLGKWSDEEMKELLSIIKKSSEASKSFAANGVKNTIANFNGKV